MRTRQVSASFHEKLYQLLQIDEAVDSFRRDLERWLCLSGSKVRSINSLLQNNACCIQ
ncbi:hypothetical protein [Aureibacillus halotolerans]|uniref:hypothetical protein n=1 Tax=Aureibacillus halotolerans TaxID=1508390 RepID=UPI0014150458|nr:hypothetical protein [Aureibacillus halotolerans]